MEKQKNRSEVSNEFKWDLSKIYLNDKLWYQDFEKISEEIKKISEFKNKLNNANSILNYLQTENELERKLYKIYYYAHLKNDEDTSNPVNQKMKGKADTLLANYDNLKSYANPELMLLDFKDILKFIDENPSLDEYKKKLEMFYRFKDHILSATEENIVTSLSKILDSSYQIYSSLTDSDIKFGNIVVEGNEVELTESNYSIYIRSNNREVRKQAFKKLFTVFGSYKNTLASTFASNVDSLVSISKIKKYNNSIEASLFGDNISLDIYNNLIDTVNNNLDVIHKYYKLKKENLKLNEFHLYDVYASLVSSYERDFSFDEAKEIVIKSLSILGDDYTKNLQKAFDEKWIDVYNNEGKRSGAYSSGFYDTNPYILLNFEGKINDVSTLAHELGHSMHTYYSCLNNKYQYSNYKIFVAEVASTVNELLLNHYMLENAKIKEEKLYILNQLMELFRTTIYRQTMFAEFERDIHKKYEQGEVLNSELVCSEYYKLNQKYFGSNVIVDDLIKYEWQRVPHFYYNFYVYKYAIGLSCACYIVENLIAGTNDMKNKYLKFLSSGGSNYPANLLKEASIDVNSKEVIESAIKMFNDVLEKFIKISKR